MLGSHLLELQKCRSLDPESHWPNFEYDSPTDETANLCSLNGTPENENPASLLLNSSNSRAAKVFSNNNNNDDGLPSPNAVLARRSLESQQHHKQKRLSAFLYTDDERDASKITAYTHFVEKSLKLRGMRRALIRILKILTPTLLKARLTLQKREYTAAGVTPKLCQKTSFSSKLDDEETYNLTKYGVNHPAFRQSNLPNYYESFLFLLKIPLNLTNEWLKIRIAQKQQREPDPITLDKLIQDCRDCLTAACDIKAFYQDYVQACTEDQTLLDKLLVDDLEDFEANFYNMFDIYLEYVRLWADHQTSLHPVTTDWSQSLITHLENEWKFAKKVACNMLSGESDAAMKFW
uniref:Mitogen-activated protein kinase kinase kinase N-terminal domain-containing protein n=1 Tax=Romanomermis culicivorax TaxID=13658 RepID=A0A915K8X1_ROMCU